MLYLSRCLERGWLCLRRRILGICVTSADQSANPERNLESNLPVARRGISLWSARYRPSRVARDGALPRVPSLARCIRPFFVRGDRATRPPVPGPPAARGTPTAAAVDACKANAPVASPTLLYSYLRATMGSTRVARRAGTDAATMAQAARIRAAAPSIIGS